MPISQPLSIAVAATLGAYGVTLVVLGASRAPERRGRPRAPCDLVPDFILPAGQVDDALIVSFALRSVLRGAGKYLVREHWPGPQQSLRAICRLV